MKAQEEEVNCKKRELEVLVEEEAKLGADIKKSQREIESLIKGLEDVEDLLNEVNIILCMTRHIEYLLCTIESLILGWK